MSQAMELFQNIMRHQGGASMSGRVQWSPSQAALRPQQKHAANRTFAGMQRASSSISAAAHGHRSGIASPASPSLPLVVASSAASSVVETAAPPSTSTRPSTWSSDAARQAAFSRAEPPEASDVQASVSGRLPPWLKGSYLRNGPGEYIGFNALHMFDGYSLLCRFEVDGASNSVIASHRFLQSKAWTHFEQTGKMRWREFATPLRTDSWLEKAREFATTILGTMGLSQGVTDNASVSLLPRPDGMAWALTETIAGTYAVDARSLQTLQQVQYSDGIRGDLTTAHPTVMPNGDIINFVSTVGLGFQVYRLKGGATAEAPERQLIATVPHRHPLSPAWVHDFPSTDRYAVIPEFPLYFNLPSLMGFGDRDYMFMDWKPEEGSRLHVVDLQTGAVRSFNAPPCFVFHWANAFQSEDGRFLHLDASVYDDPEICNALYLKNARAGPEEGNDMPRSHFRRLTIDLSQPDGSLLGGWQPLVADEDSYGRFFEFPAVSPGVKGQAYRYAWGSCAARPTNLGNAMVKFDVAEGTAQVWHEAGTLTGEPVFIPAPEPASGDDGALVSMLIQADGTAALLVLDGRTFTEVARASVPHSLCTGFHGCWIPAQ